MHLVVGLAAGGRGPLTGTPYKLYAVEAGAQGLSPWLFLLVTVFVVPLTYLLGKKQVAL